MRFLVDMCVDVRVAEWLRSQGHDAVHLRDQGLQRLADGEIFRKAASERSFNPDEFANMSTPTISSISTADARRCGNWHPRA
ncbi:MAG: DUF5615 family PIN-like protein [Betaproteobacteria bacterium]|nr:DUF5615 family PIN-like protein [Betaproteobacteria bacterium]